MIGKLRGVLDSVAADHLVIDVGGVGYEVACSSRTLAALPAVGETVTLAIETHVREDAIKLYGFLSDPERAWFRLLQSVQGVGAKVALATLGTLSPDELASAVALQDKTAITRAPGVGPKVALRIVNELKDKAPPMPLHVAPALSARQAGNLQAAPAPAASPASDAVSALINLGYALPQANAAIAVALKSAGDAVKTEDLIRLGLKELARL